MSKSRTYAYTYYPQLTLSPNYQPDDWMMAMAREETYFKTLNLKKGVKAHFLGKEKCPTTYKIHFQGYIRFANQKTFKQTKKWFGLDKIHIEPAKGNDQHNYDYCLARGKYENKEGFINKIIEYGEVSVQGKRTDIERAVDIIKETQSVSAVLDEVHNYQAVRHAELFLKYKEKPRQIAPIEVIWLYGSSGKGKTKYVYDREPEPFRPTTFKWWEGYDAQEVVLIDDFRTEFCSFVELLKLTDIYPFRVETKGGSRQVQFKKIYITTPSDLEETHASYQTNEDIYQLQRRITQLINIDDL